MIHDDRQTRSTRRWRRGSVAAALTGLAATLALGPAPAQASPGHLSASIQATGSALAGRPTTFAARLHHSGAAHASSYSVSFGDHSTRLHGRHRPPASLRHTFANAGRYVVTLRVHSTSGRTTTSRTPVFVLTPPPPTTTTTVDPTTQNVVPHASTVASFTPSAGGIGQSVVITGSGFTAPATVTFNGVAAIATVNSATKITTTVPNGASTGPLVVTSNGSTTNAGTFTVTVSLGLNPKAGPPGKTVAVYGAGFAANEAVDLYVGTTAQAIETTDAHGNFVDTAVSIPASAQPGNLKITGVGRRSGTAAQTTYLVRTDSTTLGFGPNRRGWNPYENTLTQANVSQLGQAFRTASTGNQVTSTPTVSGGYAYVAAYNTVRQYNASTGASGWSTTLAGASYSTPTVSGSTLYVADSEGLYALSVATGAVVWHQTTTQTLQYSATAVSGSLVYAAGGGSMIAFNATTGAVVWTFSVSSGTSYSAPTVVNGTAYFSATDSYIYALDAATGSLQWKYLAGGYVEGALPVVNGSVYAGASDGYLYAVDATSGTLQWKYNTGSAVYGTPAVGGDDHVYVGNSNGGFFSVDADSGSGIWSNSAGAGYNSNAVYANGVAYATDTNGRIRAFGSDGSTLWSAGIGSSNFDAGVTVVNGTLYAGSAYSYLYAYTLNGVG